MQIFFLYGHIFCNIIYTRIKYYVELNIFINSGLLFFYFKANLDLGKQAMKVQQRTLWQKWQNCWWIKPWFMIFGTMFSRKCNIFVKKKVSCLLLFLSILLFFKVILIQFYIFYFHWLLYTLIIDLTWRWNLCYMNTFINSHFFNLKIQQKHNMLITLIAGF